MKNIYLFIVASLIAFICPLCLHSKPVSDQAGIDFPGWPESYQQVPLQQLPITESEKKFAESFPGKTVRFTDGSRQFIFRWITSPTRKLHPAADCYRANGFNIKHLPQVIDSENNVWSAFEAENDSQILKVRERIFDNTGNSWPDASQWYWNAVFDDTARYWWSITIVENQLSY